ncbi:MAG: hypothetical protein HOP29_02785 [Phycisphaerales bacterium]|nr:hypothetical protein [Phycisphaerales bacterium]
MERSIEILTALSLGIFGLSHLLQPRVWVRFFIDLREKGEPGVFTVAFMHLPFGLFILAFHRVWTGIPLVVTLLGCAWTFKGTLYFCFPAIGLRGMGMVSLERLYFFRVGGVALILLGGVIGYSLLTSMPPFPLGR